MTVTLEIAPEVAEALRAMAQNAGLEPERYIARALTELVARHRGSPTPLPREEAVLLQQISQGLPVETWERYHDLVAMRRAERLTPEEHAELMRLTNDVEMWNARRIELVADLARLRNLPLAAMMSELGLPSFNV